MNDIFDLLLTILLLTLGGLVFTTVMAVAVVRSRQRRFRQRAQETIGLLDDWQPVAHQAPPPTDLVASIQELSTLAVKLQGQQAASAESELENILKRMASAPPNGRWVGHWPNSGFVEGENLIIPGGPSLIDGKIHLPRD
ncbi:hypothetical protein L6Q21_08385 [Sandaracinobacter sp. RS1-74]|uniref:hypothetical protein n=1 Tax=Sandaracinobacteroides sayramensis TaxID=2913411 RepID=UPI001EDC881E|nr:hypothetical protein [Sandaracinobacteroides sayramensis]MCG2840998.1 hypothetical protein [Sandaracinobacteroides sayramensis]